VNLDFLDDYFNLSLTQIANTCREILQEAIQSEVYDKYNPTKYERTYQLLNNVRVDIKNGFTYVYVNTGNMKYTSNSKSGEDFTSAVPFVINYGHNINGQGGKFMYDYYPSRDYMRVAKERIERELGVTVEIINNELV